MIKLLAIPTPSRKSYNKLCKRLGEEGYNWLYTNWRQHGKETCISIDGDTIGYGDRGWYEDKGGYKIMSVEEYLDQWREEDILEDYTGNRIKILGICGKLYFPSKVNEFDKVSGRFYTREDLEISFKLTNDKE